MVKEIENVITLGLTDHEKTILEEANTILLELQNQLGETAFLTSLSTGEYVHSSSFPRLRGILSGLTESDYFILERRKN